jgi:uncharacterized NAD-dependent epimerase/dehydratase family protein
MSVPAPFDIDAPYLILVGDCSQALNAKTGFGLVHWARERCLAQWRLQGEAVDLGLPDLTPAAAAAAGARTLVIGVAPFGGGFTPAWVAAIVEALEAGLDIASGMHTRLASVPEIAAAAQRAGRRLHDVRHAVRAFPLATGRRRTGRRVLMVGTDCAVGKKYAALAIHRALEARGVPAHFRATGQTGILISGGGIAVDAVVTDFIAGAAEALSPDADPSHWDVIEGQGSIFHPAYAAVTLGLIHGSQPDAIVVCHHPGRDTIDGYPEFPTPSVAECADLVLRVARLTNRDVQLAGVSYNTSALSDDARGQLFADTIEQLAVPCIDPMVTGGDAIAAHLIEAFR